MRASNAKFVGLKVVIHEKATLLPLVWATHLWNKNCKFLKEEIPCFRARNYGKFFPESIEYWILQRPLFCCRPTNWVVLWLNFEEELVKVLPQTKWERLNQTFLSRSVGIEHAMHFPKERKKVSFIILRTIVCANSQFPKFIIFAKKWWSIIYITNHIFQR